MKDWAVFGAIGIILIRTIFLILGISKWERLSRIFFLLCIYQGLNWITENVSFYLFIHSWNNMPLLNFHNGFRLVLFFLIYKEMLWQGTWFRKQLVWMVLIGLGSLSLYMLVLGSGEESSGHGSSLVDAFILGLTFYVLVQELSRRPIAELGVQPYVWIISANLIYTSINIVFWQIFSIMSDGVMQNQGAIFFWIHLSSMMIWELLVLVGLWKALFPSKIYRSSSLW
ncbi:hypothetical protein [Pontibacter sp. G13]|uniref:hypothetical protein n=1 Tax=Pontibacter sp. G13 TaxID=3074898 RepID=UPI00288A4443|nr:hypothetical protein [Pontibacter sp. G13]WNJ17089.1 hypothetical protein RJD25_19720 [Pontibacter sp. G13]